MNSITKQITLKKLLSGLEAYVSGDGFNEEITLSAAIVDGKPLIFVSNYVLDGKCVRKYMKSSESFKTLKSAKESI